MDTNSTNQKSSSAANPEPSDESNKSVDNKSSEDNLNVQSESSKESSKEAVECKDKSKFKKIESRYMQSTQQWVNKRNETGNQANTSREQKSRNTSRNPTPERRMKKASTPQTNEKSLNVSGISVINKVDDKLLLPELNKYGKPLITGRRSLAPRKLAFLGEPSKSTTQSRPTPMAVGLEESKKNSIMASINNSMYLQTLFMKLKAEQALKTRREDAKNKVNRIWNQSNKIREQILEVQDCVQHMEDMLKGIDILEKQKSHLEEYLKVREQTDALFNGLAHLIDEQKRLIRLENCSEEDFVALTRLMSTDVSSQGLEATDKACRSLENAEQLSTEIKYLEKQLEESFKSFGKCIAELDKYHTIESKLKDKSLSLKGLF